MSKIRPRVSDNYKDEYGATGDAGYISLQGSPEQFAQGLEQYSDTIPEFSAVARSGTDYIGMDGSRTSVKSDYHRGDYEYVRPNEATPWRSKDIIKKSIEICENLGRIDDIFSLMADFSCQGIDLEHPVPATNRFYKNWFKTVKGKERSERFCYYLLKQGNVPIYRHWGKQKVKDVKKWKSVHGANEFAATANVDDIKIQKRRIPVKYKFLNIMTIEPEHGDDNPLYGLDTKEQYYLKITRSIQDAISLPNSSGFMDPLRNLGVVAGNAKRVPLKKENFSVYFYKKDDWKPWAMPILRPIFSDIAMLRKMKLADVSALDGIISSVRLWRLGSLEHKIAPNPGLINKLRNILAVNAGGGTLDMVWGPDLDFKDSSTDAHQFLGSAKYQPVLDAIYSGLGVPPALRGVTGEGLGNNFISLQTFIERLQYVRGVLVEFWANELKIVQAALGLPSLPEITFSKMVLGDESAEKQLLLNLVDRGIISEEAVQRYFGFSPDIENARNVREDKMREKGKKQPKASPYHNPQLVHGLKKVFAQQGEVTPSEVGIELDERKDGEETKMEKMTKTQIELSKNKGGSGSQNLNNAGKPVGDEGGRPKNAKDATKRKQKKITPQTNAFISSYGWANYAQQRISEILTPKYLQAKGKRNSRMLTANEQIECEELKTAMLFSLPLRSDVNAETVYKFLEEPKPLDEEISTAIASSVAHIRETTGKNATVKEVRDICAIIYSLNSAESQEENNGES